MSNVSRNEAYKNWQAIEKQIKILEQNNQDAKHLIEGREKWRNLYFELSNLKPTNPNVANAKLRGI